MRFYALNVLCLSLHWLLLASEALEQSSKANYRLFAMKIAGER